MLFETNILKVSVQMFLVTTNSDDVQGVIDIASFSLSFSKLNSTESTEYVGLEFTEYYFCNFYFAKNSILQILQNLQNIIFGLFLF